MTIKQQWIVVGTIVAVLGGGLFAATRILGNELFPVGVGSKAPAFAASTIDGASQVKSIGNYQGKVVLLNIWATWCAPCRVEMPSIEALHERYGPKGLHVVAVSVDDPGAEEGIRKFLDEYHLTFEVLHDPTRAIEQQYQTRGVPQTFLIGKDGVIRKNVIGRTNWNSAANRALVASLLGVPGDTASPLPEADVRADSARTPNDPARPRSG
jgi:cytochrome c biogenesis protein CcmG, thiol:disulfide interchange protein DsbE